MIDICKDSDLQGSQQIRLCAGRGIVWIQIYYWKAEQMN